MAGNGSAARYAGLKIGVLFGGLSSEREISIRSGDNVYLALKSLGLNAVKIDVGRDVAQVIAKEKIDIAFIALHGKYGEDGSIQGLLEMMGVPYTGPGILGSAIGMNKTATKKILSESGIPVPRSVKIDSANLDNALNLVQEKIGFPVVFKPNTEGSSIGVVLIHNKKEWEEKVPGLIRDFPDSFAEQYVHGREITIGVIGGKGEPDVMPILELKPKKEFYDLEAKYTKGMTDFEIPAKIKHDKNELICRYCREAYKELYLSGVVRFDAMLDSEENPYFLEVNTIPGMTDTSDIPAIGKAGGIPFEEMVLRILDGCNPGKDKA